MDLVCNFVLLVGYLVSDIEVQDSGPTTFVHFSLSPRRESHDGHHPARGDDVRVTAIRDVARSLAGLRRGSLVQVKGHLRPRVADWAGTRHQTQNVHADEVHCLTAA